MLEAWLAGEVPHAVMADWCEERGIAFPRVVATIHRSRPRSPCWSSVEAERRLGHADHISLSVSGSRSGGKTASASGSSEESVSQSQSQSRDGAGPRSWSGARRLLFRTSNSVGWFWSRSGCRTST